MHLCGYCLSGNFNDTTMYNKKDVSLERCSHCGYRLNFFPTNPNYVLKGKFKPVYNADLTVTEKTSYSCTYDGQRIVSQAFKEYCVKQGYQGLQFVEFPKDPFHFHLIVTNQVIFDAERRKTAFDKLCPVCGNYESVIGANPAYLKITEPLPDGFYRTDLLFASGDEKSPLIIVGIETADKLKDAKLKGVDFRPVYGLGNEHNKDASEIATGQG
jgi:hypothetical protein